LELVDAAAAEAEAEVDVEDEVDADLDVVVVAVDDEVLVVDPVAAAGVPEDEVLVVTAVDVWLFVDAAEDVAVEVAADVVDAPAAVEQTTESGRLSTPFVLQRSLAKETVAF
jgi:hypothetical protein